MNLHEVKTEKSPCVHPEFQCCVQVTAELN
uniref:Uncharacterized protein n=1 Tax=Anguilla anguilla TaxID=7936 RepID=A0A0E9R6W1_ANGAN